MGRVTPAAETAGCRIVGEDVDADDDVDDNDDDDDDDDNDNDDDDGDGDGRPDDDDEDDTISFPRPPSGHRALCRTLQKHSKAAPTAAWRWVRVTHLTRRMVSFTKMMMIIIIIVIIIRLLMMIMKDDECDGFELSIRPLALSL